MKQYLKQFWGIAFVFVCAFLAETVAFLFYDETLPFSDGIYFAIGSFQTIGLSLILCFLLYVLIGLVSQKFSKIICGILLATICVANAGINIYYQKTGLLLDSELLLRPLQETIFTIQNTLYLWRYVAILLGFVLYIVVSQIFANRSFCKRFIIVVSSCFAALFILGIVFTSTKKSPADKLSFFITDCLGINESYAIQIDLDKDGTLPYNSEYMSIYREMFPDWELTDSLFPLERKNTLPNVLGDFFVSSSERPNIVVFVVESLGSDIYGNNPDSVSFNPFLQELSKKALVWNNCFATTPRSFGAIPAITGSLPYGMKGFQYGEMPNHNSLFTILKSNGYQSSVFYASDLNFDRVSNYLRKQKIDVVPQFYTMYRQDSSYKEYKKGVGVVSDKDGWGYKDAELFEKSFDYVQKRDGQKPFVDLYITITMHEDLELVDRDLRDYYYQKADSLLSTMSNPFKCSDGVLASTLYTDDALKKIMEKYSRLESYKNTIFVITGDHSLNLQRANPLNPYRVPLIIYSPLLQKHTCFNSIVSHSAITPSLLSLLMNNFAVTKSSTIHCVSDGLDTTHEFSSSLKSYFMPYNRKIRDGIFGEYYISLKSKQPEVYRIDSSLSLKRVDDATIADRLYQQLLSLVYVNTYVYENNRLTKNPIFKNENKKILKEWFIDSLSFCNNGHYLSFLNDTLKQCSSEVTIELRADFMFLGETSTMDSRNFVLEQKDCDGKTIYKGHKILKHVKSIYPKQKTWYSLFFTEDITSECEIDVPVKLYLYRETTSQKDIFLKNIHIRLLE